MFMPQRILYPQTEPIIYKKDALVKAGLTTGDDGSVTLDNLYLGKYVVKRNAGTTKSDMHRRKPGNHPFLCRKQCGEGHGKRDIQKMTAKKQA